MIAVVVVAAVAIVVLGAAVGVMLRSQERERSQWASERRTLIDRAIARHTGEVLALDRQARLPTLGEREETPLVEGLM